MTSIITSPLSTAQITEVLTQLAVDKYHKKCHYSAFIVWDLNWLIHIIQSVIYTKQIDGKTCVRESYKNHTLCALSAKILRRNLLVLSAIFVSTLWSI